VVTNVPTTGSIVMVVGEGEPVMFFAFGSKPSVLRNKDVSTGPFVAAYNFFVAPVSVPTNKDIAGAWVVLWPSYYRITVSI
jgi:hypothetical protein